MKKTTLLAVTALTFTCLGGQTLTAQAAPKNMGQIISNRNGNRVIISYGSNCSPNIQDILDKLQNCIPSITLPDCDIPEVDVPEADTPEVDIPETDVPEVDIPETDVPEVDIPETDAPEVNFPENNKPGNGSTGENTPESTPETDSSAGQHAYIKEVVALVNAERAKEGLAPLTIDTKVQAAAQVRAKECEQLFSHTRPNGTSFSTALKEQNVSYRSAGENIAWGQKTPQEVVTAWMNSSGHRANIMNANFTTIGVGYYENARGTDYWCQLFTR